MKKVKFVVEARREYPSLERLAVMLNRTQMSTGKPIDCVQWELSREAGVIRCQFPIGPGLQDKKNCSDRVGRILAEYTLLDQEPELLRHFFLYRFGLRDSLETEMLITEAVSIMDGENETCKFGKGSGRERRLQKLAAHFSLYLDNNERLNLDGFLRFRLSDYRVEVQEAAETAIEDRLMEKQYQEFMTLLRSMVNGQETRTSTVHVLHSGENNFRLLDEELRPLEHIVIEADVVEEIGVQATSGEQEESMVVSRLLAASPRQLFIHTSDPESQVIRTIVGIFGDRAALCPAIPLQ